MKFFSASEFGFYDDSFHAEIPADAVPISDELYSDLLAAQSQGARIVAGNDGSPIAEFPAPPTLAELKAAKNEEINQSRLVANLGTFTHAGKVFACDQLSRSDIDGTANHIALFGTFPPDFPGAWKAVDNSYLLMSSTDAFKEFYKAMAAQGSANFARAQELKAQLAQATTAEQVAAITW